MLRIYPTVKHWFVKSTAEKIESKIAKNHEILKEVDKTLVKMGKESSVLQKAIKEELAIGTYELQNKLVDGIQSEIPDNIKTKLNALKLSPKEWKQATQIKFIIKMSLKN
ncbi:MAG: hypothetical protein RCG15_00740 [Candidatus Rickettsia vulgarisii]